MGNESSKSCTLSPVACATASRSCWIPNVGSICVISPNAGAPALSSKCTGTLPTFNSNVTQLAPLWPRNANAVPSVGCPAKGNSSSTVKMRTRTPCNRSVSTPRGRMNVVSDRFISLARDCISVSVNPRPSENTAREFPSSGCEEKTSHCVIARRRDCRNGNGKDWLMNLPGGGKPQAQRLLLAARTLMPAYDLAMQEISLYQRDADICRLTSVRADFYSCCVICPTYPGATCCCMCRPLCG